jgi:hypothetical protein
LVVVVYEPPVVSRASLERELGLIVAGTAVFVVGDLVRRHGLTELETKALLRAFGHAYTDDAGTPFDGEDDPTIELERESVLRALDPSRRR